MYQKLKTFWGSIPNPVQAAIVAFLSGAGAAAAHAYEDAGFHMSWGELHHLLPTFLAAGVAAARILYMVPSRKALPAEAPVQAQAAKAGE